MSGDAALGSIKDRSPRVNEAWAISIPGSYLKPLEPLWSVILGLKLWIDLSVRFTQCGMGQMHWYLPRMFCSGVLSRVYCPGLRLLPLNFGAEGYWEKALHPYMIAQHLDAAPQPPPSRTRPLFPTTYLHT